MSMTMSMPTSTSTPNPNLNRPSKGGEDKIPLQYRILYLKRLLYCMKMDTNTTSDASNRVMNLSSDDTNIHNKSKNGGSQDISIQDGIRIRLNQVDLARSMFYQIECSLLNDNDLRQHHNDNKDDIEFNEDTDEFESSEDDSTVKLLTHLRSEVHSACAFVHSRLTLLYEENHSISSPTSAAADATALKNSTSAEIVEDIFGEDSEDSYVDDDYNTDEDSEMDDIAELAMEQDAIENVENSNMTSVKQTRQQNVEEEKQTAEAILQNEISEMASQLKRSTLSINMTLANQNTDLNEMENLAQSNLDKTKEATDKVTDQVKRGWRKSVGRWMMIFIVFGTWMFCFLTIRVVPKRTGACLFFCDGDDEEYYYERMKKQRRREREKKESESKERHDQSSQQQPDQQKQRRQKHDRNDHDQLASSSYSTSKRIVNAKFSYCTKKKECTNPRSQLQHQRHLDIMDDHAPNGEDIANELLDEDKSIRQKENMKKAQEETDEVGLNRVRDGWDSDSDSYQDDVLSSDSDDDYEKFVVDDDILDNDFYSDDFDEDLVDDYDEENTKLDYTLADFVSAAIGGEVLLLEEIISQRPEWIHHRDGNGWQVIHEAVTKGDIDSVVSLVDLGGADVNSRTGKDDGGSVLWWARKFGLGEDNKIVEYLLELGAISIAPGEIVDYDRFEEEEDQDKENEVFDEENLNRDEDGMNNIPETIGINVHQNESTISDNDRNDDHLEMKTDNNQDGTFLQDNNVVITEDKGTENIVVENEVHTQSEMSNDSMNNESPLQKIQENDSSDGVKILSALVSQNNHINVMDKGVKQYDKVQQRDVVDNENVHNSILDMVEGNDIQVKTVIDDQSKPHGATLHDEEYESSSITPKTKFGNDLNIPDVIKSNENDSDEEEEDAEEFYEIHGKSNLKDSPQITNFHIEADNQSASQSRNFQGGTDISSQVLPHVGFGDDRNTRDFDERDENNKNYSRLKYNVDMNEISEERETSLDNLHKDGEDVRVDGINTAEDGEANDSRVEDNIDTKSTAMHKSLKDCHDKSSLIDHYNSVYPADQVILGSNHLRTSQTSEATEGAENDDAPSVIEERSSDDSESKILNDERAKEDLDEVDFTPYDLRQMAAVTTDQNLLESYIRQRPSWLLEPDQNGWLPIHEAARAGNVDSLDTIFRSDVMDMKDINSRTGEYGTGGSALWWAKQRHGSNHPVVKFLRERGCLDLPPI